MTEHDNDRRVPVSFNPEQVQWLAQVLLTLQRGGDVRVVMRAKVAETTLATICRAKVRAGTVRPKRARFQSEKCPNGHEYTPENTSFRYGRTRRCRICVRDGNKRLRQRKRLEREMERLKAECKESA